MNQEMLHFLYIFSWISFLMHSFQEFERVQDAVQEGKVHWNAYVFLAFTVIAVAAFFLQVATYLPI